MSVVRRAFNEIFGLFVDDGVLAIAAIAWIIVTALALPAVGASDALRAIVLFAGLAAVLVGSALGRARQRH